MDIRLTLTPSQARALCDVLATSRARQHDTTLGPLWRELNVRLLAAPLANGSLRPTVFPSD